VSIGLKQVKWARPFKNANRRGSAPRKVTDAVSVGDLIRLSRDNDGTWKLSQAPAVSGALVAVSPLDGALRAVVGGYHFSDSKFNRAVDARRQPGSSFKPFVYAAALDKGWTPASLIKDERISVRLNNRKVWKPNNFDHKTMGPIRLRLALTKSRNLASVYLLQRVGLDDARDFVGRFGFDLKDLPLGLSMALGTAEVSLMQMAGAYSVFANGGFRVHPYYISRVEDGAGEVVYQANPPRACDDCWFRYEESPAVTSVLNPVGAERADRVLEPRLTFQMNSIMQDVIKFGTGRKALVLEREDIAGKTGTTNDVRDSWFCGYQKDLVTVAWMGFDDFSPLGKGETGGQAGLGMWVDFMRQALTGKPQAILDVPEGMIELRIDKRRGTPTKSKGSHTIVEWIREEYELMTLGPEPVRYASERKARRAPRPASAPRVLDELF
jgi:penicillin-binding protein 1A